MSRPFKLLLADDHQIVIDGLEFVLSADKDIQVVGTAKNGLEVLDFVENNQVDLIVMDINMPEMDGITCAKKIKSDKPGIKIIILTQYTQKTFIQEVAQIVDGCLIKSNGGKELTKAVHRVMGDEKYFDQFDEEGPSSEILGKREIEIIGLISEGLTSEQIGERLYISVHTVKTHRKNILRKLELNSTPDLITYALNNGLI